jgi:hypothetical protein
MGVGSRTFINGLFRKSMSDVLLFPSPWYWIFSWYRNAEQPPWILRHSFLTGSAQSWNHCLPASTVIEPSVKQSAILHSQMLVGDRIHDKRGSHGYQLIFWGTYSLVRSNVVWDSEECIQELDRWQYSHSLFMTGRRGKVKSRIKVCSHKDKWQIPLWQYWSRVTNLPPGCWRTFLR